MTMYRPLPQFAPVRPPTPTPTLMRIMKRQEILKPPSSSNQLRFDYATSFQGRIYARAAPRTLQSTFPQLESCQYATMTPQVTV